jgi:hypothetical protein
VALAVGRSYFVLIHFFMTRERLHQHIASESVKGFSIIIGAVDEMMKMIEILVGVFC